MDTPGVELALPLPARPTTRRAAQTSQHTALKLQHFAVVIETEMACLARIMRKHEYVDPVAWYVDLNAGPGYYPELDRCGSPILAAQAATTQSVQLEAYLCERERTNHTSLVTALQHQGGMHLYGPHAYGGQKLTHPDGFVSVDTYPMDHHDLVPAIVRHHLAWFYGRPKGQRRQRYGAVFSDEDGGMPPLLVLQAFAEHLRYLDLILYIAGTNVKRRVRSGIDPWPYDIEACRTIIGKTRWIIREPVGAHQWTFLIGTGWEGYPESAGLGFYSIDSPRGREIYAYVRELRRQALAGGDT